MGEVVLYDLPSRMILNYKGIPYRTEWTDFHEIEPKLKEIGIPPNVGHWKEYTIPAIRLPGGTGIQDSLPIAEKLESLYPEPSLHLDSGVHKQIEEAGAELIVPGLLPFFLPPVRDFILNEQSRTIFVEDRETRLGMTLDEFATQRGGDAGWQAVEPAFRKFVEAINSHKLDDGPFVLGSRVSYADFMIAGMLRWASKLDPNVFEKMMAVDDSLGRLYRACASWMVRDGY